MPPELRDRHNPLLGTSPRTGRCGARGAARRYPAGWLACASVTQASPLCLSAGGFSPPSVVLGREGEKNDVGVDCDVVSGRHAELKVERRSGRLVATDLGSTNGSAIRRAKGGGAFAALGGGDMAMEPGVAYELRDGDTLVLATRAMLKVSAAAAGAAEAASEASAPPAVKTAAPMFGFSKKKAGVPAEEEEAPASKPAFGLKPPQAAKAEKPLSFTLKMGR